MFSEITTELHLDINHDSSSVSDVKLFGLKTCLWNYFVVVLLTKVEAQTMLRCVGSVDWGIHENVTISTQLSKLILYGFSSRLIQIGLFPLGPQNKLQHISTWLNATDNELDTLGCGKALAKHVLKSVGF